MCIFFLISAATQLISLSNLDKKWSGKILITDISISVTSPGYSTLKSLELLPWTAIAEPHRTQIISLDSLKLDGKSIDLTNEEVTITWSIDGKRYKGTSASFKITTVGVRTCTVTISTPISSSSEDSSSSPYSVSHDFTLAVKYVRRELRALTEEDRTTFFDALYTVKHSLLLVITQILLLSKYRCTLPKRKLG